MRLNLLAALACAGTLHVGNAHAGYVLHDISSGGVFESALAINNAGQVTGESGFADGSTGFYYSAGTGLLRFSDQLPSGTPSTAATRGVDINAAGQVVGTWSPTGGNHSRGFTYTPGGGVQDLGLPFLPNDITDAGQVVGLDDAGGPSNQVVVVDPVTGTRRSTSPVPLIGVAGQRGDGALVGTRYEAPVVFGALGGVLQDGAWTDVPVPARATQSYAAAFNEGGTVVGAYEWRFAPAKAWLNNAFAFVDGTFVDIGAQIRGSWASAATAVSETDLVVGNVSLSFDDRGEGFLYDLASRSFVDLALDPLSTAGWTHLRFSDINDLGQIVGSGLFNGQARAFILAPTAPVPEPATVWMGLLGLGAVLATRRRARQLRQA